MNLVDLLRETVARCPDRVSIVDGEVSLSYLELLHAVDNAAATLGRLGIESGQMIGLQLDNSAAFIVLTYALWQCDAVVVPIPMETPAASALELARKMDVAAMLCQSAPSDSHSADTLCIAGKSVHLLRLPERTLTRKPIGHAALVRFTSGTTHRSKGVVLSHEKILERIRAANETLCVNSHDTVMWSLPLSHHFVVTIIRYLWVGAGIVLLKNMAARYVIDQTSRHHGTVLYASPFQYDALTQDESDHGLNTVRMAISTTTALTQDIADRFRQRYGLPLIQAYGIIELGLVCVNMGDPIGRPTSVGQPVSGFRVRLLTRESYTDDGPERGEIAVSGPGFFDAYYDPWVAADAVLEDGWFLTGDVGSLDADGYLFLHSRTNSVIHVAGMKVFPEEVEQVLNLSPLVRESRAYGVRHPHLGEVVEAEVVLANVGAEASTETLRLHCCDHLPAHKVPNRVRLVEQLPKTGTTHKIARRRDKELTH